jgi:chemotaxis protein methyltransferase CheR
LTGEKEIPEYIEPDLHLSARSFDRLAAFTTQELGIKMNESKALMIQSRLMRRVRELGLRSIDDYCEHLFSSPHAAAERVHFINAITTNKTDFFREPEHFRFLVNKVLPEFERLQVLYPNQRLNVWSAPCSSGEEPYTLAMVLSEYAATHPGFEFHILATDISTKVLQIAKEGIYGKQQVAPVPIEMRRKYIRQGRGEQHSLVRISPALRRLVSFHPLNFMDAEYGVRGMVHVIFCRNVLIYFDRPTQQAVINKLCRHLIPGGFLFTSHSESLHGLDVPLASLGHACFRKHPE